MQLLCTLRNHCRQWPRNTRYQADATPYLGRTFTGWIAPACGWRTYWITSSTSASKVVGMARPSTLAVLMLMTNSNLVGCITGSSEGLAPWRIRLATTPTKPPAVGNSRLARLCGGYCQGQGWTPATLS